MLALDCCIICMNPSSFCITSVFKRQSSTPYSCSRGGRLRVPFLRVCVCVMMAPADTLHLIVQECCILWLLGACLFWRESCDIFKDHLNILMYQCTKNIFVMKFNIMWIFSVCYHYFFVVFQITHLSLNIKKKYMKTFVLQEHDQPTDHRFLHQRSSRQTGAPRALGDLLVDVVFDIQVLKTISEWKISVIFFNSYGNLKILLDVIEKNENKIYNSDV
jgi:hypothetical protein